MKLEAQMLPKTEKEILCRELLNEFGVGQIIHQGDELIHSCVLPFNFHKHGDLKPSAALNYELLTYKCLGCGMGGGLLWFIGTCRGSGTEEARRWLDKETGLNGAVMELPRLLQYFDAIYSQKNDRKHVLPVFSERVLDDWLAIHPYLTEVRQVPVSNIIRMSVGWDPEKNRIVLPHFVGGTLTGWQKRRLSNADPDKTKYRNSPDFPKDYTLYNYDYFAPVAIVVESPMSVLRHVHHHHWEATFGASVTPGQINQLAKHPKVILWFDNDKAGWKATEDVGNSLLPYCDVWVVDSPWNADAGDMSDELVDQIIREGVVPFSVWRQPEALYCLECQDRIPCDCSEED